MSISIGWRGGGVPANPIVPEMLPTVAGSMAFPDEAAVEAERL
jgi:hypothetical protein